MKHLVNVRLFAAVVLVAAGLAASAVPAEASTTTWRAVYRSTTTSILSGVTARSGSNAWAVGTIYQGGTPVDHPYVLHWNGSSWQRVALPSQVGPLTTMHVKASSATNVWIFGYLSPYDYPEAVRWDGQAWHVVAMPADASSDNPVVLSASNVWTGGGGTICTVSSTGYASCVTKLWHWNGVSWRYYRVNTMVTGLAATSAENVWAVGMNDPHASIGQLVAYRWNGTSWSWVHMPHPWISGEPGIAVSTGSAWMAAWQAKWPNPGLLQHWNGPTWQDLIAPRTLPTSTDVITDGHGGVWLGAYARYNNGTWFDETPGPDFVGDNGFVLSDIARIPFTTTVWGVGALSPSNSVFYGLIAVHGTIP